MAPIARLCGSMVVLVLFSSRLLPAADAAKEPVEDLRAALESLSDVQAKSLLPVPMRKKEWEAEAKAWEKRITAAEKALIRLDDLCRAVLLAEWPQWQPGRDQPDEMLKVVARVHEALGKKIIASARGDLAKGVSSRRLAVLTVIANLAKGEQHPGHLGTSRAIFLTFKEDIINLLRGEKDARVRAAALRTLPSLRVRSAEMAPFLKSGLEKTATLEERRAAAGVLQLILAALPFPRPDRFADRLLPGKAIAEPFSLAGWKERSEPLLGFTGRGARDGDPPVRRLCLAALSVAIDEFRKCCLVDVENSGLRFAVPRPTPWNVPEQELARFRQSWKEPLHALNDELAAAREALKDGDLPVCLAAHKTIESAATLRLALGNRALFDPAIKEKKDLFDEPIKAVPVLAESLKHKELRVRLAALYALETLTVDAAPAAVALAVALKDDNRFIRWGAARALRNMAPTGADNATVAALAAVLSDDSPDVRNTAAGALARRGPAAKGAVASLRKAVKNGDQKMRLLAARALAAVGKEAKPAEPELAALLADEQPAIRTAAATALGRLGTLKKEARAALTEALNDADSDVRMAAAAALLGD